MSLIYVAILAGVTIGVLVAKRMGGLRERLRSLLNSVLVYVVYALIFSIGLKSGGRLAEIVGEWGLGVVLNVLLYAVTPLALSLVFAVALMRSVGEGMDVS